MQGLQLVKNTIQLDDASALCYELRNLVENHQFEMAHKLLASKTIPVEVLVDDFLQAIALYDLPSMHFLWPFLEDVAHKSQRENIFEQTHIAMSNINMECIRFLWEHGVYSHSQKTQLRALRVACFQGASLLAHFLFQQTILPPKTLRTARAFYFCRACDTGDLELVQKLWQSCVAHKADMSGLRCALSHAKFAKRRNIIQFFYKQQKIKSSRAISFDQKHNTDTLIESIHNLYY